MEEEIIYKIKVDGEDKLKQITKNTDELTESTKESSKEFEVNGVSVSSVSDKLKSFASVAGVAGLAVGSLIAIVARSRQAQEALSRAMAGASGILDKLTKDTLSLVSAQDDAEESSSGWGDTLLAIVAPGLELVNVLTGGYIDKLKEAGAEAAEFEGKLQKIKVAQLGLAASNKDLIRQEEEQRQIRDNVNNTFEVRIAANERIFQLEKERLSVALESINAEKEVIDAQVERIGRENASFELLAKQAELETQIADIREESSGKISEALVNRIGLQNEQLEVLRAEIELKRTLAFEEENAELLREFNHQRELERLEELYGPRGENIKQTYQRIEALDLESEFTDEATQANSEYTAETEKNTKAKIQNTQAQLDNSNNLQEASGLALRVAGENKAVSSATTLIQTYLSAQKAYASQIIPGDPTSIFRAFVAASLATASGLGRVASINAVGFAKGGLTGKRIGPNDGTPITRSNGDNLLATVKTGEVILNERQQAMLGGARTFARLGVPGFAGGGLVASSSEARKSQNQLAQAIAGMNVVVTVEDINAGFDRVDTINKMAQVV